MTQPVWETAPGDLGTYSADTPINVQLSCVPVSPSTAVTYELLSGSLPPGTLEISTDGVLSGVANGVDNPETSEFTVRARDTFGNIKDRYFTMTVTGHRVPKLEEGALLATIEDSAWVEIPIHYTNDVQGNVINIEVSHGALPPGLELYPDFVIRGYAKPPVDITGRPAVKTFTFTMLLTSKAGNDTATYSIIVSNQKINNLRNTRKPVLLNSNPLTQYRDGDPYYGYYIENNFLGTFRSEDKFSFKMIGYDFDGDPIEYRYLDLPDGFVGDENTGWITGLSIVPENTVNDLTFMVRVRKKNKPDEVFSPFIFYTIRITNNVDTEITFNNDSYLGSMYNGQTCTLDVSATSSLNLEYEVIDGSLPPNLSLLPTGELVGRIAQQPNSELTEVGTITNFEFTVRAKSTLYPTVISDRVYNIDVEQVFDSAYETLYFQGYLAPADRLIVDSMLSNEELIPTSYLYRANDINFSKATSVNFVHMYGVVPESVETHFNNIGINHYPKRITLGEIKTAVARDTNGNTIYEVVYASVIDNLNNQQTGVSISKEVKMKKQVSTYLNTYTTTDGDTKTSYIGHDNIGVEYYTSLTPGLTNLLHPNSLNNMRLQIANTIGQNLDIRFLPLWMSSQQLDGNTLGYIPAWVICYTKPGKSALIKAAIDKTMTKKLNNVNIVLDRYMIDKSSTYNYNTYLDTPSWTDLPSATPEPEPRNKHDVFVLFPNKTILGDHK